MENTETSTEEISAEKKVRDMEFYSFWVCFSKILLEMENKKIIPKDAHKLQDKIYPQLVQIHNFVDHEFQPFSKKIGKKIREKLKEAIDEVLAEKQKKPKK